MKNIYVLLFAMTSICTNSNPYQHQIEYTQSIKVDSIMFEYVYQLKKNEEVIGNVYAKWKNDSVFSELLILKINNKKTDTLYHIQKCKLKSKNCVDLSFDCNEFWGYRFGLKKDNYFELTYLSNNGTIESDILTIEYDKQKDTIKLLITP